MEQLEKKLSEQESLNLITSMINKAKESYNDTGISAMMWGIVIAVCSLVKLSELQFNYHLPVDIYWLTILAIIPQIFLSIREKRHQKVKSYDDVYMDYVWLGFGISIALMIFITNSIFQETEKTAFNFHEFIAPLFLLLYGIPTFITGAACKFKPMLWGGVLCWLCCVIAIYTSVKVDLLLTALSAIAAWLIPGILMQKNYKKAKKELADSNV
jgi:hypothetical protein